MDLMNCYALRRLEAAASKRWWGESETENEGVASAETTPRHGMEEERAEDDRARTADRYLLRIGGTEGRPAALAAAS